MNSGNVLFLYITLLARVVLATGRILDYDKSTALTVRRAGYRLQVIID